MRKNNETMAEEVERMKTEANELERQVIIARKQNDEQDAQLKTSQAKQATLENELQTARKELEAIDELNARLQRERQEAQK